MRIHVPIKLRWSDLDAYGHVNNAAMLTLLEESRISVERILRVLADGMPAPGRSSVGDGTPGAAVLEAAARPSFSGLRSYPPPPMLVPEESEPPTLRKSCSVSLPLICISL